MTRAAPFEIPVNASDPGARDALEQLMDQLNRAGVTDYTISQRLMRRRNHGRVPAAFFRCEDQKVGTFDTYAVVGMATGKAMGTATLTGDRVYAIPYVAHGPALQLIELGFDVTTSAASTVRLGIYDSWDALNEADLRGQCGPRNLVWESDTISVSTTGAKTVEPNVTLEPGRLYWFAYHCHTTSPAVRALHREGQRPFLGALAVGGTAIPWGMYHAQTYGALPQSWTTTPVAVAGDDCPALYAQFETALVTKRHEIPLFSPNFDGLRLRRMRFLHPVDMGGGGSGATVSIEAGIRTDNTFTSYGSFDSAQKKVRRGTPWMLNGQEDVDARVRPGDLLEAQIELRGWPDVDLGDSVVQWDLTFVGGR